MLLQMPMCDCAADTEQEATARPKALRVVHSDESVPEEIDRLVAAYYAAAEMRFNAAEAEPDRKKNLRVASDMLLAWCAEDERRLKGSD